MTKLGRWLNYKCSAKDETAFANQFVVMVAKAYVKISRK